MLAFRACCIIAPVFLGFVVVHGSAHVNALIVLCVSPCSLADSAHCSSRVQHVAEVVYRIRLFADVYRISSLQCCLQPSSVLSVLPLQRLDQSCDFELEGSFVAHAVARKLNIGKSSHLLEASLIAPALLHTHPRNRTEVFSTEGRVLHSSALPLPRTGSGARKDVQKLWEHAADLWPRLSGFLGVSFGTSALAPWGPLSPF